MLNLPYAGSRPYAKTEASWFRGRAGELALLRDTYDEQAREHGKLLLIYGPSGVGKTSFVQAGLWPQVRLSKDVTSLIRFEPQPNESLGEFAQRIRQQVGRISGSRNERPLVFIDEIDQTMGYSLDGDIDERTQGVIRLLLEFLSQATQRGIARVVIAAREPWSRYFEEAPATRAFLLSRLEFFRLHFLSPAGLEEVLRAPLKRWLEAHPLPGLAEQSLYKRYFSELSANPIALPLFSAQVHTLLKGSKTWNPAPPTILDYAVNWAETTVRDWPASRREKLPIFFELFQAAANSHTPYGGRSAPMNFLAADPDAREVAGHLIHARLVSLQGDRWSSAELHLSHQQLFSAWDRAAPYVPKAESESNGRDDDEASGDGSPLGQPAAS